jgi:drug/metabolite transporter (DMT)-like permease
MERMSRRDSLLAALVAVLWGFNFVVIDWGMGSVPPLLFAAIRFVLVAFPACLLVPRPQAPGSVRVPLRVDARRDAAGPGRAGAAVAGGVHHRDRRGGAA